MTMYLGILFLCSTVVPGSFSNDDIHNYMSPQEVQKVFHTDHDSVPKYEIVKVHLSNLHTRLHKRLISKTMKMYVKAFDEDINLWLNPGDSVLAGADLPVYFATYSSSKPQRVEFSLEDGWMEEVGYILEDPEMQASFVIGTEDFGDYRVNGYIGSKKVAVRSLPRRVAEEYRRRRGSVGDSDDLDSSYHVVYKSINPYEESYPAIPVNMTAVRERMSRSVLEVPDILYPEILSVVEYSMYRTYEDDILGLLEYLLAFWNGVDLKYRSLESPKIRFHISAIILAEDPRATPYIADNSLSDEAFNSTASIDSAAEFYYAVKDTFPLDSYDIAVTMTKLKFGLDEKANVVGKAFVGGACYTNHTKKKTLGVVLIRDNDAFYGVILAAHELGHQFGSHHDQYQGDCITETGFVMGYTQWYTKNTSDFSPCSILAFNIYLHKNKLECLYNPPVYAGKTLPKVMPGRIRNLDEQCEAIGFERSCIIKYISIYETCTNILCVNKQGDCVESKIGAIDGTSCGGDKFCLHMNCVRL